MTRYSKSRNAGGGGALLLWVSSCVASGPPVPDSNSKSSPIHPPETSAPGDEAPVEPVARFEHRVAAWPNREGRSECPPAMTAGVSYSDLKMHRSDPHKGMLAMVGQLDSWGCVFGDEFTPFGVDACPGSFYDSIFEDPTVATCTGILIGEDLVLAPGHCVECEGAGFEQCGEINFLANYDSLSISVEDRGPLAADMYSAKLCSAGGRGGADDWAIFRLNRKVKDGAIVSVEREGAPAAGTGYALHYPNGVPLRRGPVELLPEAGNGSLSHIRMSAFGHSSGSAIFGESEGPPRYLGMLVGLVSGGFIPPAAECVSEFICERGPGGELLEPSNCSLAEMIPASALHGPVHAARAGNCPLLAS